VNEKHGKQAAGNRLKTPGLTHSRAISNERLEVGIAHLV
jgi:hypothetical protein